MSNYDANILKEKVDILWFNLIIALIGQSYEYSQNVLGIRMVDKCQSVLS